VKSLARPADKEEILRRLRTLRSDAARRWGRMTVHQMVCHCSDAYRMAMGELPVSEGSYPVPRVLVKWIALYVPLPWPPGRISTRPEIDQACGAGTRPADFAADVAQLAALVERFTGMGASLRGRPHPTFGPMSARAWLRWGYLHTAHHLRQFGV
jgi:hypothetical protein